MQLNVYQAFVATSDMEQYTKTITLTTVTSTPVSEMCGYANGELIQKL